MSKAINEVQKLCNDIRKGIARWKTLRDNGGTDPFWSDGFNMNLCRNHVIYDRRRIEEIITENGINPPDELLIPVPPEVSPDYMSRHVSAADMQRMHMQRKATKKPEYDENQLELFA